MKEVLLMAFASLATAWNSGLLDRAGRADALLLPLEGQLAYAEQQYYRIDQQMERECHAEWHQARLTVARVRKIHPLHFPLCTVHTRPICSASTAEPFKAKEPIMMNRRGVLLMANATRWCSSSHFAGRGDEAFPPIGIQAAELPDGAPNKEASGTDGRRVAEWSKFTQLRPQGPDHLRIGVPTPV